MNNENASSVAATNNNTAPAEQNNSKPQLTSEQLLTNISKGRMTLLTPIRAAGGDITELVWNFRNLTGWEYATAMDCDASANTFRISNKQALSLFAASAAKEVVTRDKDGNVVHPLDAQDIRQRIGIDDCAKAVQVATLFFLGSVREGNKRISNE